MEREPYDWRFFLAAGLGLFVVGEALELAGAGPAAHDALVGLFLAVLGGLCLRDWWTCGSRHCAVTGPAYLLLALAAFLVAAGAAPFAMGPVWWGFGLVVAVGIALSLGEAEEAGA